VDRDRADGVSEFTNLPPVGRHWKVLFRIGPGKASAVRVTRTWSRRMTVPWLATIVSTTTSAISRPTLPFRRPSSGL